MLTSKNVCTNIIYYIIICTYTINLVGDKHEHYNQSKNRFFYKATTKNELIRKIGSKFSYGLGSSILE